MEYYHRETSSLNEWDAWALRAGLLIYGSYCFSFFLNPMIQKVFIDKSIGIFELLSKHMRFFVLMTIGAIIAGIFPCYDYINHRVYFTVISFLVGIFALTETYISYKRLPFKLLTPTRHKATIYIVTIQVVMMIIRCIIDIIIFIFCYTGPDNDDLYIFVRVMRIISGCLFTVSEFWVSKITNDVIATPRKDLTPSTRLQLKEIKLKLQQLALANYVGGVCAVIDIANHWIEIQMTQAFVNFVGCTAFVFYGNLFRLSLEGEREGEYEIPTSRAATVSAGSGSPVPISRDPHDSGNSPISSSSNSASV